MAVAGAEEDAAAEDEAEARRRAFGPEETKETLLCFHETIIKITIPGFATMVLFYGWHGLLRSFAGARNGGKDLCTVGGADDFVEQL